MHLLSVESKDFELCIEHYRVLNREAEQSCPNGIVLYNDAPLCTLALDDGLQQPGHEPEEHLGRRVGALLL